MDIKKLDAIYSHPKKYIGYWRKTMFDFSSEYPYPFPALYPLNQQDIITKAKNILQKNGWVECYFGFSSCRLCGLKKNGSNEYLINYQDNTYVIPIGYFHYLETHNIKIDDKLVEIIKYYDEME